MAENVETSPGRVKVLGYTICSIERRQNHRADLRWINRRLFQVETDAYLLAILIKDNPFISNELCP